MAHEPYILAVDLGTSGCKSVLVSASGRVAGWEFQAVPLHVLPGGGAEQDPRDWWQAFLATARRLVGRGLVPPGDILAVCCSTQGEGTVAVDARGEPLMNAVLWMDMRGAPYLRRITGGPPRVAGYGAARLVRWLRLTGGAPSLTGKDPAAHMLYIRHACPDVYRRTHKFLNVLDYMNLCLTGETVATPDSILTSWVTDNRDSARVVYSPVLVRGSGIDAAKFPEIVRCDQVIGDLKAEVAALLGLGAGVKVVAGAIDTTAAAVGSGAVADYDAHLYIGTSSWIAAHVPFKKTDLGSAIASVPCAIPGKYLMIVMQTTAGGNLAFLRDNLLYPDDELRAGGPPPDVYAVLDRIAAGVPAGSRGVMYTPWIFGERSPVEDRTVRASLLNLSLHNTRADVVRAFLEGVALNTRWLLGPAVKFLGRSLAALNVVGGGGQSAVWCQILADVLNLNIRQVRDPILVNARGAALIGAAGLGLLSFDAIPRQTEYSATYAPNAANRALYDRLFVEFVRYYGRTKDIYRRLNG